jgi:hypothetical protein
MHTIFMYGIFLHENRRRDWGLNLVREATLPGFTKVSMDGRIKFRDWDPERQFEPLWCIIPDETDSVEGVLLTTDDVTLGKLDQLEGHPDWYERVEVEAEGVKCFAYQKSERSRR